jgi:D-lactate dehydrogenase (cytochrome)
MRNCLRQVEVIKLCNCYKVPVIPFGSGTSLEGHVIPEVTGCTLPTLSFWPLITDALFVLVAISLNLRGLNKVIDLHLDDMNITIQPGLTFTELNSYLAKDGLMFPLDPGPGFAARLLIDSLWAYISFFFFLQGVDWWNDQYKL